MLFLSAIAPGSLIGAIVALQTMDTARSEQPRLLIVQVLVFLVAGTLAAWAVGVLWRAQRYQSQGATPAGVDQKITQLDQAAALANERIQVLESSNQALKQEADQAKSELEKLRHENEALSAKLQESIPKLRPETPRPAEPAAPAAPDESTASHLPAPPPAPTPNAPGNPPSVRLLTHDQFQTVAAELKRFSGTPIDLWQLSDPEAAALAEQLKALLTAAGWTVKITKFGALSPPRYGVSIVHRGNPAAAALAKALRSVHVAVTEESDIGGTVVIVGLKPAD